MTTTLNEVETRLATYVGKRRSQTMRTAGIADQRRTTCLTSVEIDVEGH